MTKPDLDILAALRRPGHLLSRLRKRQHDSIEQQGSKQGLPAGSIVYIGLPKSSKIDIDIIDYARQSFDERKDVSLSDALKLRKGKLRWINIDGVHDIELVRSIGERFKLHPLMLEDICNTNQRPKIDYYQNAVYIVLRMLHVQGEEIILEQISLVITKDTIITFQEGIKGDAFDSIRTRLRTKKSSLNAGGTDYLAYALIDAVVDNYYSVLDTMGDRVEVLEQEVINKPSSEQVANIHRLKQELILLRRSIWPVRDVLNSLIRDEHSLIKKSTHMYIRDVYDHAVQIMDTIETYRDTASGLLDLYMSSISNRLNEVMKVLTIFATIFIPLTFVAGVYGMNFEYMPELTWKYGYFIVLGFMFVASLGLLYFFRRKGWL